VVAFALNMTPVQLVVGGPGGSAAKLLKDPTVTAMPRKHEENQNEFFFVIFAIFVPSWLHLL
jgi:hypothetical protein